MSTVAEDPPQATSSAWELVQLGRAGWRICDATRGPNDAERIVAYMEKGESGTLEVLWVRSPCPTRSRYRDMDDLLAELDAAVAAPRQSRSMRPSVIPHFPPKGR